MTKNRLYQKEDYARIMDFLDKMFKLNGNQHCWLPARWEYMEHLVNPLYIFRGHRDCHTTIRIWENTVQEIVGIILAEETDNTFIQIHPDYRHLEEEMLLWAEENISLPSKDGNSKTITVWAHDDDLLRQELLSRHGFKSSEGFNYQTKQSLDTELPEIILPKGFSVSSIAEGTDISKKCEASARAFNSTGLPLEVYHSMQSAPMYRPDLDIVIRTETGSVASFCIVWFDEKNRIGMFEPVGTDPAYQRKGLGQAVLYEGMRRLKELGATTAYVEAYGEWRGDFYKSAGFVPFGKDRVWEKVF